MDAGELVVTIRADASRLESAIAEAKKELEALENRSGALKLSGSIEKCAKAAEGFRKGIRGVKTELDSRAIRSSLSAIAESAERMKTEIEDAVRSAKLDGLISESERAEGAAEGLAESAGRLAISLESAEDAGKSAGLKSFRDSVSAAGTQISALRESVTGLVGSLSSMPSASVSVDTSGARSALSSLLAVYNSVASVLGLGKVSGGGGGGGGNSKYQKDITALEHLKKLEQVNYEQELEHLLELEKKYTNKRGKSTLSEKDRRDLEERIFEVREKIRKEALDADMDEYKHRKALGELTVQDEIDCLEKIKKAHELTQEELWDIDEQLCDLRKQQSEKQAEEYKSGVQDTYSDVVAALQKRYDAERDLETKALQDKLKALDEEQEAEDEAAKQKEYKEKLADLERRLRTEKSARERRELQKEIDELIADEEARLRENERDKQRDEINAEIDAVNDKYDKLTSEENLRQEALRICMDGNLAEITALIESYGGEWKNAGESLAQALTDGLIGGSDGILGMLKNVQDALTESVNAQLQGITDTVYSKSDPARSGINIEVGELVVREEADIEKIAQALLDQIESAGRG